MGNEIEQPMSELFAGGYSIVADELRQNGPWNIFCWLSLIFLKAHLKDKYLRFFRDQREGDASIGELHSWEDLHHAHCLSRSFYTGCVLNANVLGSLLVLPAKVRPHIEPFDYCDLTLSQTMLLRLDDTAIIAVLNDSMGALSFFSKELERIDGPLSPLQLREITARLAAINLHLSERPRFFSEFDRFEETYEINCERPDELRGEKWRPELYGRILHHLCKDLLEDDTATGEILSHIKAGNYTFLFGEDGNFCATTWMR